MNWDQVGAIGELVSGLAVLVTLVYLAMQIRQAKNLMLSNAHQSRTDRNIAITHFMANDIQSLHRSTGELELDKLDNAQKLRATLVFSSSLRHFEDMHYQFNLGVIDEETWQANLGGIRQFTSNPVSRALWQDCKHMFRKSFTEFVDSIIANQDVSQG